MFLIFLVTLFSATDDDRGTKPPPKRPRGGEVTITTDEVASYEECVLQLQEECKQTKPSKKKAHEIHLQWKKSLGHQECTLFIVSM